jgi:predicted esterase
MADLSFEDFQKRIQDLYQRQQYARAHDLAEQHAGTYPDQTPVVNYWRVCMAVRVGKPAEALQLLTDMINSGFWYGETLLRRSPSLQPLQGDPTFEELVEKNREQQVKDQEQLFPLITLRSRGGCQDDEHPCPLMVALHGNGVTAQSSVDFWKPAASAGWLVGIPQSSQAMWKDAYIWSDLETARMEIEQHINLLNRQYAVDARRTVLAGHSMGGELAVWLALSGATEVRGIVAIGPGGPFMDNPDDWAELVQAYSGQPLRAYLIYGEADTSIQQQNIHVLAEMLQKSGAACEVESLPGVGHDYNPAYIAPFLRGLKFVLD